MTNIIQTCYQAIKKINVSKDEKEKLFVELAESGFTEDLKKKLIDYLDKDSKALKEKIIKLKEKK